MNRSSLQTLCLTILLTVLNLVPAVGQDFAAMRHDPRRAVFPQPKVTVAGIMTSNDNWTDASQAGVYTIEACAGGAVTPLHKSEAMVNTAAAILHNGTLYAVEGSIDGYFYRQYSSTTWSSIGSHEEIDDVNLPSDLTYDAVTGKVYGGFWSADYGGYSRFCSFSLSSAEASEIKNATRDERDIFAIAAAPDGTIYCLFGAFDYLATLDPRTGAVERIGVTGLSPKVNILEGRCSSMVYDAANSRLLAAIYQESGYGANKQHFSALYSINPATGAATEIMRFDGSATFAGLWIYNDQPDPLAPAAASNISVAIDGLMGDVFFDVPSKSIGGAPLTGNLVASVSVNGAETIQGQIVPGSRTCVGGLDFAEGANEVVITLASGDLRGQSASTTVWVGDDIPSPVSNVALHVADGQAHLSWDAPTVGANGGTLDQAKLRYRVVRFPGATVVADGLTATSFTDTQLDPSLRTVYYAVTVSNDKGSAPAVESNRALAAGAFAVPFAEHFDSADDFALWTVEDLNGSVTWSYDKSGKCARYDFPNDLTPGDDWLISPAIRLETGRSYKVAYKYRGQSKSYVESFEVAVAQAPNAAAMGQPIASYIDFNNTSYADGSASFKADADGEYYLGFHCISKPKMWSIYLDDITLEAIDSRVPAPVADLVVTPAPLGALKATISFTAPAVDTEGTSLLRLSSARVVRAADGAVVATLTELTPGEHYEVVDESLTESGIAVYTVSCSNDIGESLAASAQAYVGVDLPGAVGNLTVVEVDRHPVLAWTAPTAGANGGWFDPDKVVYRIVRSDGQVVAENLTDLSYTDLSYTSPATSQDALWYLVTPWSDGKRGTYAQSDLVLLGAPYAPGAETFPGAEMTYYPWIAQSDMAVNASWTLDTSGYTPVTADQNGDRGLATFHSVGEAAGVKSWFYSPMFDISALDSPALTFRLYHSTSIAGDASMSVYACGDDGIFAPLGADIARCEGDADGWVRHSLDLAAFKGAHRLRVAFCGTADGLADIYLDNISLENSLATDAAIASFKAPAKIASGIEGEYVVGVLNAGSTPLTAVRVSLSCDGATLATADLAVLAAGASTEVVVSAALPATGSRVVTATITADGDMRPDNNTATATVAVVDPVIPAPTALTVTADSTTGAALLSWQTPAAQAALTDDVESYPDWAIDGIGQWSMFDGDYAPTYYINYNAGEYAHASERKAFQVLNVEALGINIWEQGKAHSGKRLFAALCSVDFVNNDWLISPQLNGAEQWISFYARSFTTQDTAPERMMVSISDVDTDPVNFTDVTPDYIELDGTWRRYSYYMPEGTRHFAIRCVSDQSFAMFVDDISFNDLTVPAWQVTGYEVWRNGTKIADTAETTYADAEATDKAVYTVRAVYGSHGTSPDSEQAVFAASGTGMAVEATIEAVYTPAGIALDPEASLAPGIYLVRYSDGSVRRLLVK